MTAQRTTLFSLCLLAITLVFNQTDKLELLQTGVQMKYSNALWTLVALILANGISYGWRFYAEYKELDISALKKSSRDALESIQKFRDYELDGVVPANIEQFVKIVKRAQENDISSVWEKLSPAYAKTIEELIEFERSFQGRVTISGPTNIRATATELRNLLAELRPFTDQTATLIKDLKQTRIDEETNVHVRKLAIDARDLANNVEGPVRSMNNELVLKPMLGNARDKLFDFWLPILLSSFSAACALGKISAL